MRVCSAHLILLVLSVLHRISVGIKKFKFMMEMACQMEQQGAGGDALEQLFSLMEKEGCLSASSSASP